MNIKIKSINICYSTRINIIQKYIKLYVSCDKISENKYPIIISDNRNYHVTCNKLKTTYVFNIWLAP